MTALVDEREAAFYQYIESKVEYDAAIEAAGDVPWHEGDLNARRDLFMRRYTRPSPPAGLPIIPSLKAIQR